MTTATTTLATSARERRVDALSRLAALTAEEQGLQARRDAAVRAGDARAMLRADARRLDLPGEVHAARVAVATAELDEISDKFDSLADAERAALSDKEAAEAAYAKADAAIRAARLQHMSAQGRVQTAQQHRDRLYQARREAQRRLDALTAEKKG